MKKLLIAVTLAILVSLSVVSPALAGKPSGAPPQDCQGAVVMAKEVSDSFAVPTSCPGRQP